MDGKICVETGFRVSHIGRDGEKLRIGSGSGSCGRFVAVDELVVATGFRPDFDFLREVRLSLDPAVECPPILAPLIDPNIHSCGTVRPHGARELAQPEPGFYFAGMKSYGRAPTFLMLTGYEQVRSIVAEIAGDHEAAAPRRAGAARDRRLLGPRPGDQSRQDGRQRRWMLRRPGAGTEGRRGTERLLRGRREGQAGRQEGLRLLMTPHAPMPPGPPGGAADHG